MYLHHQGRDGVGVGVIDGAGVGVKVGVNVGVGVKVGCGNPVGVGVGEEVGVDVGVGVGVGPAAHPTDEQTLILPHLKSVPVPVIVSAVDSILLLTRGALHPGFWPKRRPASPDTNGVAIDVPERVE